MKLKETKRELYIDGKYSTLYGFDWKNKQIIYRQAGLFFFFFFFIYFF